MVKLQFGILYLALGPRPDFSCGDQSEEADKFTSKSSFKAYIAKLVAAVSRVHVKSGRIGFLVYGQAGPCIDRCVGGCMVGGVLNGVLYYLDVGGGGGGLVRRNLVIGGTLVWWW